jgi:hypothetical protein
MRTSFMMILWGFLIVAVDINVQEVDLLTPDILGYVLIGDALTRLTGVNREFDKARPYVIAASAVWVVSLFQLLPARLAGIAGTVFDLALMWHISTGIVQLAIERSNLDLARTATTRRTWYVVAALANIVLAAAALIAPAVVSVLIVPAVILSLTIGLLVLLVIRRAALEIV